MLAYALVMKARTISWDLIEALLVEAGRDRAWLQDELKVGSNNVTNWKKRGVPNDFAPAIGRLFGVNTDYLLAVPGAQKHVGEQAPAISEGPPIDQSEYFSELIFLAGKCNEVGKKQLLAFAESQAKLAGYSFGARRNKK